ncbi:hypothetical protein P9869_24550 [Streptomyces ossamyceticus]|nr:hypothetical protein [Streptomyces ossamyceticus]
MWRGLPGGDCARVVNASAGKVMDVAKRHANGSDVRRRSRLSTNCRPWRLVPTTA